MSRSASTFGACPFAVEHLEHPCPPAWLTALLQGASVTMSTSATDAASAKIELRVQATPTLTFCEARLPNAIRLSGSQLDQATYDIYMLLSQHLAWGRPNASMRVMHPWRFWNFVPDIVAPLRDGRDRYMAFNAGRHRAFEQWHGRGFQPRLVAASAVDAMGRDLIIQMVAGPQRTTAIENPRQRSAYRYSQRFGPVPPSFARASLVGQVDPGRPHVYVAGTASIVGEDSLHAGDVVAQTNETLRNLDALLEQVRQQEPALRARYRHLRVYLVQPDDEGDVLAILHEAMPHVERVEVMSARLCRPELLVEIDGMARCHRSRSADQPSHPPTTPPSEGQHL